MDITIFHDPLSAESRNFLDALGITIPEGDDVTVAIGQDAVRIVSGHDACVAVCPAFPGYPAAIVTVDGQQYVLAHPATWAEVAAWAADPVPAVPVKQTVFTRAEFMRLFTQEEIDALLDAQNTDTDVRRMWAFINAVGWADMDDPLTLGSLQILRAKNFIPTDERLQEIKCGVYKM